MANRSKLHFPVATITVRLTNDLESIIGKFPSAPRPLRARRSLDPSRCACTKNSSLPIERKKLFLRGEIKIGSSESWYKLFYSNPLSFVTLLSSCLSYPRGQ